MRRGARPACEADRSETRWGEVPERSKSLAEGDVPNQFAGLGYVQTLAEPLLCGVFSLYALPHLRPAAGRSSRPNAAEMRSWR
jgi:hypothetical protein